MRLKSTCKPRKGLGLFASLFASQLSFQLSFTGYYLLRKNHLPRFVENFSQNKFRHVNYNLVKKTYTLKEQPHTLKETVAKDMLKLK